MENMKFVYGPVPSRRLGISLGISPIPKKTCNYSCIYCQLGRTDHMTNTRGYFFNVAEIIAEFESVLDEDTQFDVVTIVGEGEPTLYAGLGDLIDEIKKRTNKPVAVITNGALLYDKQLQYEIGKADIVLPTMDAYDEKSLKRINRPHKSLRYEDIVRGLKEFSELYEGQLWIEVMLIKGVNDDMDSLGRYAKMLKDIKYEKLYLNTPVRPPAESGVDAVEHEGMEVAARLLGGIPIDLLESQGFHSEISDDYDAVLSIIKRHPMNQFEVEGFLKARGCENPDEIMIRIRQDEGVAVIHYKGYDTYRLR